MRLNPVFIRVSTVKCVPHFNAIENYNAGLDLDLVSDFRFCLSANSSSAFPKYPNNQNWPYDIGNCSTQKWFLKLPEVSWDVLVKRLKPQIPTKDLGHQSREFRRSQSHLLHPGENSLANIARMLIWHIWVCLKIGYIPNYSHLIGIMIINHWVWGYTIFRHTHIKKNPKMEEIHFLIGDHMFLPLIAMMPWSTPMIFQ